jgi:hypothetical protein
VPQLNRLARRVLLAPNLVSRAAARTAGAREEAWMLCQPREVRESYVREVVDRGEDPVHAEIWMLKQPEAVRLSYIREVLEPSLRSRATGHG